MHNGYVKLLEGQFCQSQRFVFTYANLLWRANPGQLHKVGENSKKRLQLMMP